MSPAPVDWLPALAVLGGGLAIGAVLVWRVLASGRLGPPPAAAAPAALEQRDLAGKLEALLAQLGELEDTAAKRTPEQLAQERYALELEAARTLQALDRLAADRPVAILATPDSAPVASATAASEPAPEAAGEPVLAAAPGDGSALRGFLWGTGTVGALGLLLYLVTQSAQQRAPDGSMSGGGAAAPQAASPAAESDPRLQQLRAAVQRNPEDIDARLELARGLLANRDLMAVYEETQAVLQRQPGQPRALAYQSVVRLAMGQADQAEAMLRQALAADPNLADAYVSLMLVFTETGRAQQAEETLAAASQRFPSDAAALRDVLASMRQAVAQRGPAPPEGENPHASIGAEPGLPAPAESAPVPAAAAPAPPSAGTSVAGVLELDAGARSALGAGAVVYVMLRPAGAEGGPPVAVRRLPAAGFPLRFEIGAQDSMTGDEIPAQVLVEARIDTDGDVSTRPASDPYGRADGVSRGARDVRLVLKPRS